MYHIYMRVILGADHGGFEMKEELKKWLLENYEVIDVGAEKFDGDDDFVDYAKKAVEQFQQGEALLVLLCRNGVGMSIVANRYKNVRCVLGFDENQVERARSDDDVNCLALPSDYVDFEKALRMVRVFLETKFSSDEERFVRRIKKMGDVVVN